MKYIIYLGVLFMPDKNAASHRARAFASIFNKLGYKTIVIGMNQDNRENKFGINYEDYILYETTYPKSSIAWFKMLCSISCIKQVIKIYGAEQIHCIIAMDLFSPALFRLINYCKKYHINLVVDAVDWFEKSNYNFPKNIIKDLDTFFRMNYLYKKKISNMISISRFLYNKYSNIKNIVEIPGIILSSNQNNYKQNVFNNKINLCFVGSPGKKCEKEKIDWLIDAVCAINKKNRVYRLFIIGIDEQTLRVNRPDIFQKNKNMDDVKFWGRSSHKECEKLILKSDFSTIIREDNLLTRAGFPTKLGESFKYGIPVIATPSGNVSEYINCNYGFVTDKCNYNSLYKLLDELQYMKREDLEQMKKEIIQNNPLDNQKFVYVVKQFLDKLL